VDTFGVKMSKPLKAAAVAAVDWRRWTGTRSIGFLDSSATISD